MVYADNENAFGKSRDLMVALANSHAVTYTKEPFMRLPIPMKSSDIAVIKSFQQDPFKSYVQAARELGLSPKTVKRRIEKLMESDAIYLVASPNLRALDGGIMCSLLVLYDERKNTDHYRLKNALLSQLESELIYAETESFDHAYFSFMITNVVRATKIQRWVEKLEGVGSCRLDMMQEIHTFRGTLDAQIERLAEKSNEPSKGTKRVISNYA